MTLPASVSVNRAFDLVPAATLKKVAETMPAAASETPSAGDLLDRAVHAEIARFSGGLSPAAIVLAFADWAIHLAGQAARARRRSFAGCLAAGRYIRALGEGGSAVVPDQASAT
jgi:polyhydroxyalkanoate synthase subunit PhaC